MIALILAAAIQLRVPDAEQFVGKPQGTPVAAEQLPQRSQEVTALLRCPVCQGLSVADSPSEMALNMKAQVRELLSRGYTQEQILSYFEQSYGQFVLLKPRFNGAGAAVWILPVVALLIGVAVVVSKTKKLGRPVAVTAERTAVDEDPYVSRVRDLVEKA